MKVSDLMAMPAAAATPVIVYTRRSGVSAQTFNLSNT